MNIISFAPVIADNPLVLILGSMPSELSLRTGQYYGNKHNHFWRLMSEVLHEQEYEDYAERIEMLKRHRIALWDSLHSCVRPGSLDKNIKEESPNDIQKMLQENPSIRAIGFNGITAYKMYLKYSPQQQGNIELIQLPSSSPIPQRNIKNYKEKVEKWKVLQRFLDLNHTYF